MIPDIAREREHCSLSYSQVSDRKHKRYIQTELHTKSQSIKDLEMKMVQAIVKETTDKPKGCKILDVKLSED